MQSASDKVLNRAIYITMPDDKKIAADIWLPKTTETSDLLPLTVEFNRYWRIPEYVALKEWIRFLNQQGFAD